MNAEQFTTIEDCLFGAVLVSYLAGPAIFAITTYKQKKRLSSSILQFIKHGSMLLALHIVNLYLMYTFNEWMQDLFDQHILSLPVRILSTAMTWVLVMLPIGLLYKRIPKPMYLFYSGFITLLCITNTFVLFPFYAYY